MIIFFTVLLSVLKNILIFRIYRQKYVKHSSLSVWDNFDNWWAEILTLIGECISFLFFSDFFGVDHL